MNLEAVITYTVSVDEQTLRALNLYDNWDNLKPEQKRERILYAADYTAEANGFHKPLIVSCSDPILED